MASKPPLPTKKAKLPLGQDDQAELDEQDDEGALDIPDDNEVEDTPDGGAIVRFEEQQREDGETADFYRNLAEEMDEPQLNRISTQYMELIARDKEARKRRDEQYEEGIRRTGLGEDAPGGAKFEGASKVVHPMLTEACVDFAARAIKELWPANGPAKSKIEGEETDAKLDKAERKTRLMNWQLTVQAKEARAELEQLLTQVPLGGAQYLKVNWNKPRNRPTFEAVFIDDVLLPFAATNFYTAQRKTHVQYVTELQYAQRVRSGMYRDVEIAPPGMTIEQSASGEASDKVEGRSETTYNEDGLRTVYEVICYADLGIEEDATVTDGDGDEDDFDARPYIITLDKVTNKVLAIYRNWAEDDDTYEELTWMTEWPFVPWRGAYPIGLPHMIGGLAAASTGALRALLDSAHIQNTPAGMKLKGGTSGGQTLTAQPTEILEVEGGLNVDDIRKLFMPMPFNGPSPVLFQLLGFLVEGGKGVVRTSMEDLPDMTAQSPVGTTLAQIEQGLVVFSAIHARLHDAMARTLSILDRLNGQYLDEAKLEKEAGSLLAKRDDFDGTKDVVPISDPNIYSEAQRFAQVQAVSQRAQLLPGMYNLRKVEERILQTLKVPNADELLMPAIEPEEQNAISENVAASLGRGIVAMPEQDHIAHLTAHIAYMTNPMLGASPMFAPKYMPIIIGHLAEHVTLWYLQATLDLASQAVGEDVEELAKQHEKAEDNRALDRMLAKAADVVGIAAADVFASLPPIIATAQQIAQQYQQPPPADPTQVAMIGAQAQQGLAAAAQQRAQNDAQKTQQAGQLGQAKLGLDAQKAGQAAQDAEAKRAADLQKVAIQEQAEDRRAAADRQSKELMNQADNQTAIDLAQVESLTNTHIGVSTGTGINPSPE